MYRISNHQLHPVLFTMIKDIKIFITLVCFCLLTCLSARGAEQNTMGKIIDQHLEILKENPDEIESLRKVCMHYLIQANFDKALSKLAWIK